MPGYDQTGPRGNGAMTGGGRGYCALPITSNRVPGAGQGMALGRGFAERGRGRDMSAGFGVGRSRGFGLSSFGASPMPGGIPRTPYQATLSPDQEIAWLHEQADGIRGQLQSIEQRLAELSQFHNVD